MKGNPKYANLDLGTLPRRTKSCFLEALYCRCRVSVNRQVNVPFPNQPMQQLRDVRRTAITKMRNHQPKGRPPDYPSPNDMKQYDQVKAKTGKGHRRNRR